MNPEELAARQSLEILNNTIRDLCLRRDQLAASLPKAPRPKMDMVSPVTGRARSLKLGGGKKSKRSTSTDRSHG